MPSLTLKSIPQPLYERLKRSAKLHRRSLNGEAVVRLEAALTSHAIDPEAFLRDLNDLQARARLPRVTESLVRQARREGRP